MKTLLLSFAGGLLALILFFLILPLTFITIMSGGESDPIHEGPMILQLDMRYEYSDQKPNSGLGALFGETSFVDILTKLDAAATDDQVKGVFIRANEIGFGSSRAEEVRAAIKKLQANGKFVISHSQGFFVGGPSSYRAISASDEIWMQDGTDFSVPGFSLETLFLKGLFEKLGITPEIEAFYEYKNSPNVYKEDDYTDTHREAMKRLAEELWKISLRDIAEDRKDALADANTVRDVLENSPYSAAQALEFGFIDKLGWPEQAERMVREKAGNAEFVSIMEYIPQELPAKAPQIALIGGEGPIVPGANNGDFLDLDPETIIASDTTARQIYDAGENEDIKAIVFRVDSPGGSPSASDQIWNAIEYVQSEYNKPVIISMGSVAASGGYYVSMGADKILANETTITGSIGVFGGKFAIAEGLRKIGINPSRIDVGGSHASAYTSTERLTNSQRSKMIEGLERVYDRFTRLAANGRGMTQEELHEVAKGRVWTGSDALENGLIDQTGGLIDAINVAKEMADIPADKKVRIVSMVPSLTPMEAIGSMFGASASNVKTLTAVANLVGDERLKTMLIQAQSLESEPQQMSLPPIIER